MINGFVLIEERDGASAGAFSVRLRNVCKVKYWRGDQKCII
jgi:hypothetical protein